MSAGRIAVVLMAVGPLVVPASALAQSLSTGSIAGQVADATGAVLPGVTVEAASPVLIEKVRTVLTDGQGQYKIVELRPGTYSVTFTLPGFSTVKREGIDVSTGFTANVNAELRVGSVAETVTVSGASPVVDTQNVRTANVFSREALDALPTLKSLQSYAALTLSARFTNAADQDVGGSRGEVPGSGGFLVHGNRPGDARMTIDGMLFSTIAGAVAASNRGQFINQLAVEETTIQTSGGSAEYQTGGVQINIVPKSGGNTFTFTFAGNGTGSSLQSSNLTDELRARGVTTSPKVKQIYDMGGALGGPIRKDRLWVFTAHRWWGTQSTVPGQYYSATPHSLFYNPDLSRPAYQDVPHRENSVRLTWQASAKDKVTLSESVQSLHQFWQIDIPTRAPEGADRQRQPSSITQATWSRPVTDRLLFEVGATTLLTAQHNTRMPGVSLTDIPVTELSTGVNYNARATVGPLYVTDYGEGTRHDQSNQRFSTSYVTGSHALKMGIYLMEGWDRVHNAVNVTPYGPIGFSFRKPTPDAAPVPASITEWASPFDLKVRLMPDLGIYAQDQWTLKRLTLNLGLRYDHVREYAPAQSEEANLFVGRRDFSMVENVPLFNDVSPRLGVAYDLTGNGKTAVKVSVGRYVGAETTGLATANAPANRTATAATRTWADANGDYVPDCDLTNPLSNGECGRLSNVNLGLPIPATNYADNVLRGWGRRPYNWQTGLSVQQELRPGMALNVGYFRTWYGNFTAVANQVLTPGDFNSYCITAPTNARLGAASGSQICGLYDVTPTKFGQVSNLVQFASNFGNQYEHYNGVDVALNARLGQGGRLSGGVSTGQTVTDNCAVVRGNPQIAFLVNGAPASISSNAFCHVVLPWSAQTQLKFAGNYPLPWWGLQASGTYQNLPGIPIFANYVATNAEIAPSLGRNLSSCATVTGACNATATIALIQPNTLFEDRISQVDFRLSKSVRFRKARLQGMFDVYNLFNANPVLVENFAYGPSWLKPSAILSARLFKFGAQLDF